MKNKDLKFIYVNILNWIEKTDNKANISIGIKLIILGYLLTYFDTIEFISTEKFLNLWVYILTSVTGFLLFIKIIYPKLSVGETSSNLYFVHLSKKYKNNIKKAQKDLSKITEEDLQKDLINQIVILSSVADEKYRFLQKGIILMFIEIALLSLLMIG